MLQKKLANKMPFSIQEWNKTVQFRRVPSGMVC